MIDLDDLITDSPFKQMKQFTEVGVLSGAELLDPASSEARVVLNSSGAADNSTIESWLRKTT